MSIRPHQGIYISAFTLFLIVANFQTNATRGQESFHQIALSLEIPLTSQDLSISVDTLTTQLGVLEKEESDRTTLVGTIDAVLDLVRNGSDLEVRGFRLVGGDITQSAVATAFEFDTGAFDPSTSVIDFSTSNLTTNILTRDSIDEEIETIEVEAGGEFVVGLLKLFQNEGTAAIGVPKRPEAEEQNLQLQPILSELSDDGISPLRIGSIELLLENANQQQETYSVTLQLPLGGQQLHFAAVGLPVTLEYLGGGLTATGQFTIPEPSTILLLVSAVVCGMARRENY